MANPVLEAVGKDKLEIANRYIFDYNKNGKVEKLEGLLLAIRPNLKFITLGLNPIKITDGSTGKVSNFRKERRGYNMMLPEMGGRRRSRRNKSRARKSRRRHR